MRKIVINDCFGGFGLSSKAFNMYKELVGIDDDNFDDYEIKRDDLILVEVVEKLGAKANGDSAK